MAVVRFHGLGSWEDAVLSAVSAGHFALLSDARTGPSQPLPGPGEPLVVVASAADLPSLGMDGTNWVAWDIENEPGFDLAARRAGARAVLPGNIGADELGSLLEGLVTSETNATRPRQYRERSVIPVQPGSSIEIVEGIIARVAIHPEGDEVLLGLHGVGELLTGHPADGCYIELVATTDIAVRIWQWDTIRTSQDATTRLHEQLMRAEAWAAVRARPTVALRLLGILGQLADRFGDSHTDGWLIPFRLTHPMLASAIGATRSTVSRAMTALERQGYVCHQGKGAKRRLIVTMAARDSPGHA